MKTVLNLFILIVFPGLFILSAVAPVQAADKGKASVEIISPKGGDVLSRNEDIIIRYKMTPSRKGDHVHFFLNGGNAGLSLDNKGWFNMTRVNPGKHKITIKIMRKNHSPIGVETSVHVHVK